MLDTIIRGGTIVDGTGAPGKVGDIGIADGLIACVGGRLSDAAREVVDADGALVTPGFIDIHTHYDGQILWDDKLDSSFSNGVTSVIAGNCGVGFAPVRPEYRRELIELMEGVEDIPGIVLDEGLDWKWRSFPDYLDRVAARQYTMDVGISITHSPLRVFVMGARAITHEPATEQEIAEMAGLVREAMTAGAMGFSAGRSLEHLSSKGANVPGTFSEARELVELGRAMGAGGAGVFQMIPLGAAGNIVGHGESREKRLAEHDLMVEIARASSRPLTYVLLQVPEDPDEWWGMLAASEKAAADGVDLRPQMSARQIGLLLTIDGYHIFQCRPSYMEIAHLPRVERARAMRDPARRIAILSQQDVSPALAPSPQIYGFSQRFAQMLNSFYVVSDPVDYEPTEVVRLDCVAAATDRSMEEVLYDTLSAGEGLGAVAQYAFNYANGSLSETYKMLQRPRVLTGLGDGGAHLLLMSDGAMPTFQLAFWGRDRTRGPVLPVEMLVRRLTKDGADLYGLNDRGAIAPGKRADINVIDFDKLSVEMPRMHFDLPEGGGRLLQSSQGYIATMVKGKLTRRFDVDTQARPGRLIRSGRL